jgi:hypothetical protein
MGRKICYALGNRMSNDYDFLEALLTDMLDIINKFNDGKSFLISKTYEDFENYLIMKVEKKEIRSDLEAIAKLIPSLSIAKNFTSKINNSNNNSNNNSRDNSNNN